MILWRAGEPQLGGRNVRGGPVRPYFPPAQEMPWGVLGSTPGQTLRHREARRPLHCPCMDCLGSIGTNISVPGLYLLRREGIHGPGSTDTTLCMGPISPTQPRFSCQPQNGSPRISVPLLCAPNAVFPLWCAATVGTLDFATTVKCSISTKNDFVAGRGTSAGWEKCAWWAGTAIVPPGTRNALGCSREHPWTNSPAQGSTPAPSLSLYGLLGEHRHKYFCAGALFTPTRRDPWPRIHGYDLMHGGSWGHPWGSRPRGTPPTQPRFSCQPQNGSPRISVPLLCAPNAVFPLWCAATVGILDFATTVKCSISTKNDFVAGRGTSAGWEK
eukprot:gene10633-biopygen18318